ncbi:MAG: ABC transporter ATP-binding protein [Chloroflexi bacterium]|nr:ABC transporter ATP-binding protein [Chloroflexota bacterium]MCI0579983.1 ABC transporter ATP-binding protein [Chloroflexota bacterium]MCI0647485.1 ABC transporter ATP-binding protein [Chloroflexota bacterium]MCI0728712.1 ABC transporter ATP-binding protein [Chloroflexota bacterium]
MAESFSTASITLQDLSRHFGAIMAVDRVNLKIEAGTLVCLLGPSGCGKTTTLRMIAGFEEPTSGRVLLGLEDVTNVPPHARPTAMVFQSYALFPHMSVYENIAYGLRARRRPKAEIAERVGEVVTLMELQGQEKKAPPQLSGGQQQRVALARALVIRPKVLLFDEPLSNLDAQLRVRMRGEIRDLQRRLGITSVYVTHDQEEAFSIADQVAIMNKGRLIQVGTPRELYRQPADRFVAEFVGQSNVLPVEVVESGSNGAVVRLFGQTIRSRRPPPPSSPRAAIVLRPEALRLNKAGGQGVPAHVLGLSYIGPMARYTVGVQDGTVQGGSAQGGAILTVDIYNPGPDEFYPEGTPVSLQFPAEVPSLLGGDNV